MAKLAKQIKKRTSTTKSIWEKKIPFCGYDIYWWAYPVGMIFVLIHELHIRHYASLKWDEEKAKKMADRYFGKVCDIDEQGLWFCMDWGDRCFATHCYGWNRTWLIRYGYEMKLYIYNTYEIEGYKKEIRSFGWDGSEKWVLFSKVGA